VHNIFSFYIIVTINICPTIIIYCSCSVVSAVINFLAQHFGWAHLPTAMKEAHFSNRLNSKNSNEYGANAASEAGLCLLEFLYTHATSKSTVMSPPSISVGSSVTATTAPDKTKQAHIPPDRRKDHTNSPHHSQSRTRPPQPSNIANHKASTHPSCSSATVTPSSYLATTNTTDISTSTAPVDAPPRHGLPQNSLHESDGYRVIRSSGQPVNMNTSAHTAAGIDVNVSASINAHVDDNHVEGDVTGSRSNGSNSRTPRSAKKRIHFNDNATQYHTVPARGATQQCTEKEGDEYFTHPSQHKHRHRTSSSPATTTAAEKPSSSEQINNKYQILNQDPDHMINHGDLNLVFGTTAAAKPTNTTTGVQKSPKSANSDEAVSQRQQYLEKKSQFLANQAKHSAAVKQSQAPHSVSTPRNEDTYYPSEAAVDFDEGIRDLDKAHLLQFLGRELGVRATFSYQSTGSAGAGAGADDDMKVTARDCFDLKDEWSNGVLLSEMVAALNRDQKALVKEVLCLLLCVCVCLHVC
jgi:hypothetical protein